MSSKPRIALLLGDPSGVGPEMAVKLLAQPGVTELVDVVLIADPAALASGERIAGFTVPRERVALRSCDALEGRAPTLGESNAASGRYALRSLGLAADLVAEGQVQGIVFAPFNKHSLRLGGMDDEDELRWMARRWRVPGFVCEFNITGALWTSRVTSHVPLREVADLINERAVHDAVRIIAGALKRAGVERPRIAVSGLNPHAGDGGSIGREEIEIIAPAVQALRSQGFDARGPFSPDTVFIAARRGDFDAVVSMYHDQGQIAMKLMGFDSGVTLHGGLPVPVATPASGSAFDIAGRGVARIDGLRAAFDLCVKMASAAG
jgi:4-hydroxythreonine-4-phosphate dehydrogenase